MLLEQQEKRKEIFHKEIEISPQNITITSLDEEFVEKSLTVGGREYGKSGVLG